MVLARFNAGAASYAEVKFVVHGFGATRQLAYQHEHVCNLHVNRRTGEASPCLSVCSQHATLDLRKSLTKAGKDSV